MENTVIPVVFTPDEVYIVPTCVAILSMLRTKKEETIYKFYIVVSEKIDHDSLHYFTRIMEIEKEFDYQVIFMNTDVFDTKEIPIKHLSSSALYRLVLADILLEHDKCMYHDGDILVTDDLQDMFNVDLKNYYVAGIKAVANHQNTEQNVEFQKEWGFSSLDNYIFSGDIVMNLSMMREDRFTDFILNQLVEGNINEDQVLLNFYCYNKINFIPLKYCMLNRWINNDILLRYSKQVYTLPEILEAQHTPAVVHFAGSSTKPWCNLRTVYGDSWWKYAKEILDEKEYFEWYNRAEISTSKRDWRYIREKVKEYSSVMIFGYSQIGKELFTVLNNWGCKVDCFIDNDIAKQGQIYYGCRVLGVVNDFIMNKNALIINAVQRFPGQIREQLSGMGIEEDRIFDYDEKNEIYYLSIDQKYYFCEMQDILIKNFGWEPNFGK